MNIPTWLKQRPYRWIIGIILLTMLALKITYSPPSTPSPSQVIIKNHQFIVTVVKSPAAQQQGLSGTTQLAKDQGMYFPLNSQTLSSFWMKDMLIPIDIIWIKNGQVASINRNVQPPAPNTPDDLLPVYQSNSGLPDAALEISANRSQELGILPGDPVQFRP